MSTTHQRSLLIGLRYVPSVFLWAPSGEFEISTLIIFTSGFLSDHIICSLTALLRGSTPLVVLTSRLSQMFPDAKAIGVTAALYSRLAGLPSGGGGKREMLRLAWESVNKLISTRSKQTHLLTWKKDGNYGWINSLCLHPMDLMCL